MRVKPGYKKTEVGVIPQDWEVKPLHELADKIMVGIASAATHAYRERGVVMFRNQNIKPGYLDDSDVLYIAEEYENTYRNKRLRSGDLLTARTGYPGTTAIVPEQYEGAQSFTTLITRPCPTLIDSRYLCCFINSSAGQTYFEQNQIGGGQKNVNAGSLQHLLVPLPPTKAEQEAIARALGDVDALIESLDQLLAKKLHVKQGAMQELLTGKRRLPGFSGDWQTCRFDDEFVVLRNASNSRSELSGTGEVAYVHYGDVHTHPSAFLDPTTKGTFIPRTKVRTVPRLTDGDLLMVDASEDTTAIGKAVEIVGLNGREAVAGLHTMCLRGDKDGLADGFKGYLQFLPQVRAALVRLATGVSVYGITKSGVKAIEVTIPKPDEQTAIAGILSDMDAEIGAVEAKLEKARQIKQGMMQELLTGQTRLV